MFANLGFTEILILLLVLLLVFGARRIPEIGASIGQGIKEFKRSLSSKDEESERSVPPASTAPPLQPPAPAGGEPKRLSQ